MIWAWEDLKEYGTKFYRLIALPSRPEASIRLIAPSLDYYTKKQSWYLKDGLVFIKENTMAVYVSRVSRGGLSLGRNSTVHLT